MKNLIVLSLVSYFVVLSNVIAGEGVVGNGGNIILCDSLTTENQIKFNNKTLELFELNYLYGLEEDTRLFEVEDEALILTIILSKLKKLDENFHSYIKSELSDFDKNSKHFNFDFNFSNDLGQAITPEGCDVKTVVFQRQIKPYYLISNRWSSLSSVTKASLKLHEVIYKYRLKSLPERASSLPVRKLNAYLFSTAFFKASSSKLLSTLIKELEY